MELLETDTMISFMLFFFLVRDIRYSYKAGMHFSKVHDHNGIWTSHCPSFHRY